MFSKGLKSHVVKLVLLVLTIGMAGSVWAQSLRDQQIAERLEPVGDVCLAGADCVTGTVVAAAVEGGEEFEVVATFDQYCAMCHNTGMAGAPMRDNADHWDARLADVGIETVVLNAINGINAMPPRGMCTTCSDEQIAELVSYLSGYEE